MKQPKFYSKKQLGRTQAHNSSQIDVNKSRHRRTGEIFAGPEELGVLRIVITIYALICLTILSFIWFKQQ